MSQCIAKTTEGHQCSRNAGKLTPKGDPFTYSFCGNVMCFTHVAQVARRLTSDNRDIVPKLTHDQLIEFQRCGKLPTTTIATTTTKVTPPKSLNDSPKPNESFSLGDDGLTYDEILTQIKILVSRLAQFDQQQAEELSEVIENLFS